MKNFQKASPPPIKFSIPSVPPSLNEQGRHWGKTHRLKKQWANWIWICMGVQNGLFFRGIAGLKSQMRVSVTLCNSREYDDDNKRFAEKIIYDALQQLGLIYNDSPQYVERGMKFEQCPHKQRHTVIELEAAT